MNYFNYRIYIFLLFFSVSHNTFGMENNSSIVLYEGEYVNILAKKDTSHLPFVHNSSYENFSRTSYVFFQKPKAIIETITDQNVFESFEKTRVGRNSHYLLTFPNQTELRDLENTIKYEEKQFSWGPFERSFFVGYILFSYCMSDEYKKLFFYLAIGAGLMSFLKYFNFVREHSKLRAKIKYCQDQEVTLKKKRKKMIRELVDIFYRVANGEDVITPE